MSVNGAHDDAQLARIRLLLNVARLDIAKLRPTDHEMRRQIRCDLADLLKELRAPSAAVMVGRGR